MHYSAKPVLSAALAWSGPLDIPSKKDGSNFLLFTCTCTHSLQKIKLGIALRPEMVNEIYKLKGSIVLDVQAFDFRFVTVDDEKVKSLLFFSAFLSQRFVAFYIQRIALGIISVALLSYIVTTTFCLTKIYLTLRPSQQAQEQDQDHQGQRIGEGNQLNKARYREILFTALRVTNDTIGLLSPTQFSLRSHSHGITNASSFLPLGSNSFNSTLNPFWPVQFEDERYTTSSEGLFQKICFLFKRLK